MRRKLVVFDSMHCIENCTMRQRFHLNSHSNRLIAYHDFLKCFFFLKSFILKCPNVTENVGPSESGPLMLLRLLAW